MKLYYSPTSPFVRKVLVAAAELGLQLEQLPANPRPIVRDQAIVRDNPLGQVPTLVTDDGSVLYDSRVVCEYLNCIGGGRLFPADGPQRWQSLVEQSLADGLLDAAVLMRYEQMMRPAELRFTPWFEGQYEKVVSALDEFEIRAATLKDRIDIGTISLGCALGYLDFRFADRPWRGRHSLAAWFARFAERASMRLTAPPAA